MTPTTYGRDFAYCLKSHGGVRGFNASLWRFLLRCTLFCHSVATFLTSVSSYEGGCGFEEDKVFSGFGAELAAMIAGEMFRYLDGPVQRVGSTFTPVGFNPILEKEILPDEAKIYEAARKLLEY